MTDKPEKDPAAVALGKRRAEGADMREIGLKGGRPRSRKKRCPCGRYTRHTAKLRGHKCEARVC